MIPKGYSFKPSGWANVYALRQDDGSIVAELWKLKTAGGAVYWSTMPHDPYGNPQEERRTFWTRDAAILWSVAQWLEFPQVERAGSPPTRA